ncbi:hypothetical protein D3C81_1090110 [compost metagenome]
MAITGTKVCDNKNETIIENPIASASGINNAPGIPVIIKAGANTARIQSMIKSFGNAISLQASQIAWARVFPKAKCWWIFSMVTVLSSTNIPMANASPDKDMILRVCPNSFKNKTPEIIEMGMVIITISAALRSFRNRRTIRPVRTAPRIPSITKLFRALLI